MSRRPGFLVYGLLSAFVVGSAFPLYWSFIIGSVTKERAIQSPPPLYPGGHFLENARRVFDQIDFWSALANSVVPRSDVLADLWPELEDRLGAAATWPHRYSVQPSSRPCACWACSPI